jgi:Tol biopolymer transport system component
MSEDATPEGPTPDDSTPNDATPGDTPEPQPSPAPESRDLLSRRSLFSRGGAIALGVGAVTVAGVAGVSVAVMHDDGSSSDDDRKRVQLHEGTNMSAALSPDGKHIAVDLVTGIWVLPASGGTARRLTGDLQDATLPAWSPDGKRLAFQSYRDGNYHIYTIDADGGKPQQLTTGKYDHREPTFSPDGKRIALSSDRGGSYGIWLMDVSSRELTKLTDTPAEESAPRWSPDGKRVVFTVDEAAIDAVTVETGSRETLIPATGDVVLDAHEVKVYGPAFGPDGKTVSYVKVFRDTAALMLGDKKISDDGEDVFGFAPNWRGTGDVLYTADGRIRRRQASGVTDLPLTASVHVVAKRDYRHRVRNLDSRDSRDVKGIASPVVSRDGEQVAFRALNTIYLLPATGGRPKPVVSDGFFNSDPDFSPDGTKLVYASDKEGTADLWLYDITAGTSSILTELPGAQTAPRWSPDGKKIAYNDEDGAMWTIEVGSKKVQQVAPKMFMPGRPSWSADGTVLTRAAVKPFSKRFREGTSQILLIDLHGGAMKYVEPMPFRSLATRGDDGPIFSPDGKHLAFVVESTAWVVPIDAAGNFTGKPTQVTHEVTDSLAWQGPSTLVYLCKGQLRRVGMDGGKPSTIRVNLRWKRSAPPERSVIHAGRAWDGIGKQLRNDVDIVVENGHIAEVRAHRSAGNEKVVDATALTAMPGIIESHNHWHLRGRQWGDRQGRLWLSYGITTTRSPGDPAYQMVETREALESGALLGPRYLGTGEAVDGSRIYYNFMRPTLSHAQLKLELERAVGLEYDLIKTYVRLPVELQKATVESAHRSGMPLSSHYLYPAANVGMDGMEHTGATNRLGYSHTVSRLGKAYQDVQELFIRSGMSNTPTLFNSSALYATDRSLIDDERTKILFPPWEFALLEKKVSDAAKPAQSGYMTLLKANVEMVLRIHRAGGFIISGVDAPLDNVAIAQHQNLRAMVKFGFTPYEALTTATRNPARWLGMQGKLGVLAPGAHADISLVQGDPLQDIKAAAAVSQVMRGGSLYTVDELLAPFRSDRGTSSGGGGSDLTRSHPTETALASHSVAPPLAGVTEAQPWWHEPEWASHVCCGV